MKCPQCNHTMTLVGRYWMCGEHAPPVTIPAAEANVRVGLAGPSGTAVVRSQSLAQLVPRLPSTLALVIDEYNRQPDDYQALHAMCGALEITARFLTTVVLADVWKRRAASADEYPEPLLKQLLQHLERPTLGSWRTLLETAVTALPGKNTKKDCTLPDLPGYAARFCGELGGNKGDPLENSCPCGMNWPTAAGSLMIGSASSSPRTPHDSSRLWAAWRNSRPMWAWPWSLHPKSARRGNSAA